MNLGLVILLALCFFASKVKLRLTDHYAPVTTSLVMSWLKLKLSSHLDKIDKFSFLSLSLTFCFTNLLSFPFIVLPTLGRMAILPFSLVYLEQARQPCLPIRIER